MEDFIWGSFGAAIFVGLTWFFISCTNDHFDPNKEIAEQQTWDLKYTRCKEMCSGRVKTFNLSTCECQQN